MSLIGSPTPVVKTRDNEVFFCLLSREGSVLSKFRIKFFTTLDRCSFTALLSNYIEVIPVDGNRTGRTISQSTSENDWNFLYHSQTQSQRENLSLGSCSQSNTSTYASMQSLSTRNTCSQNTTQRSLVSSAFSSQSSQMISQSIDAFPQNTSAFSQPLSVILQSTTDFSSSPSSDKSHFSVFSKSGNLDEENERASQSDSTLFNTKKSSVVGTPAADIESRRSGIHNAEFNNASSVASRQHCDGDVGSLQIVPDSIVDTASKEYF
uniref:Uncharacterized protein n=1 Tax=Parascaris univalens TaxID=6257 RepID=A0A915A6L0_PARUN